MPDIFVQAGKPVPKSGLYIIVTDKSIHLNCDQICFMRNGSLANECQCSLPTTWKYSHANLEEYTLEVESTIEEIARILTPVFGQPLPRMSLDVIHDNLNNGHEDLNYLVEPIYQLLQARRIIRRSRKTGRKLITPVGRFGLDKLADDDITYSLHD